MRWGVDSYGPADAEQQVPEALRRDGEDHHSHISRLELVTRRMGRAPTFWGRYLNQRLPEHDGTVESPPDEHRLTPREVAWLHAQGCRVLPVYNGSVGRTDRLTGGRTAGAAAANQAIALCEQLEVPASVIVYADVENWAGDVGWFRGWFETMRGANRRCGVYGRPIRVVENPADPSRHYGTALAHIRSAATRREAERRIEDETRWSGGRAPRRVTTGEIWSDELRAAMTAVLVDGIVERGVDPFDGPGADAFYVWSNEPRRVLTATSDAQLGGDDIPDEFVPAEPPHASNVQTVVWQYLQNAIFSHGAHGNVDMNLASEVGFDGMW
jgi:hypothetical protein